jgi:hypothetical protein
MVTQTFRTRPWSSIITATSHFKRDMIRDKAPTFGFEAEDRAGRGSSRSQ